MTAEDEVRAAWEKLMFVGGYDGSHYALHICGIFDPPRFEGDTAESTWQAALDFTRKRKQEIAEIEEEISAVRDLYGYDHNCLGDVWERILSRLTAQRDELRNGMRAEIGGEK